MISKKVRSLEFSQMTCWRLNPKSSEYLSVWSSYCFPEVRCTSSDRVFWMFFKAVFREDRPLTEWLGDSHFVVELLGITSFHKIMGI